MSQAPKIVILKGSSHEPLLLKLKVVRCCVCGKLIVELHEEMRGSVCVQCQRCKNFNLITQ